LESFQEFAEKKLAGSQATVSLDELFMQWHDSRCRDDINDAIRRGLADVEAGRYREADEAMETIRQEFGFAKE
jgi:hypothetical protein